MPSEAKERSKSPVAKEPAIPTTDVDPSGRLRPETEEQRRLRSERLQAFLEEFEEMTDESDTPEIGAEIFRSIDEGRPYRPLFRGFY